MRPEPIILPKFDAETHTLKRFMKRFFLFGLAALYVSLASCDGERPRTTGITPAPQQVAWGRGRCVLPETIACAGDLAPADMSDIETWADRQGLALVASDAEPFLRFATDDTIAAEGYRLAVSPEGILLASSDAAGAFYGMQSLLQLTERFGRELPALEIADAPRFPYRGLMLDVSRHFRDKEFVKKQLDLMARYKFNRFHWHLTDGAGWRIAIDRYPELTEIAAWRPYPDWDAWHTGGRRYCRRDDPKADGGYYTKDDIREVIEYARRLHITVVPEIEMLGHSEEVLAVYPELSCTGEPYTCSDFCIGNEKTFQFLTDVLDEVIDLFPSEYIHIGGDEASKGAWRTCPKCKARMEREGLKDVDELQSYLIRRIERHINARGRKLLGWDEILEGGLAPNATVMSWRGVEGGIAAARSGHHAVMSPGDHCYLDFCQDDPTVEPPAAAAFLTLPTVYEYDPAPDSLGEAVVPMILGVQGNLWCERVPTEEHCEHMLWPRGVAIAEVGWTQPEHKDYDDFYARVLVEIERMQERGYHPFEQKDAVGSRVESREPVACLSTGKAVTYNTAYSPKYAAAGDGTLTDGLRGGWNYGDKRWQGWIDSDVDVVVDLERKQPLTYVGADFMQGFSADIWMPREVEISVSDDGERYTTLAVVANDIPFEYRKSVYETFAWSGEAEGRYVRIVARHNGHKGGWIFCDEIVVR